VRPRHVSNCCNRIKLFLHSSSLYAASLVLAFIGVGASPVNSAFGQGALPSYQQPNQGQNSFSAPGLVGGAVQPGMMPPATNWQVVPPGQLPPTTNWQVVPPGQLPPTTNWQVVPPGQLPPQLSGNIWQSIMVNRVNTGSILQGTMQDTISSKLSKVGDIFTIVLDQGYSWQDKLIIPAGARVLGSVIAVNPAKKMANGAPGNLQVSIQTIVFPDGRTAPLFAFMQMNPNAQNNTKTNQGGQLDNKIPLSSYANSARGMGMSALSGVTRVFGFRMSSQRLSKSGSDFSLSKADQVALKLTRTFDLANLTLPPGGIATPVNQPNGSFSSSGDLNPSQPGSPSSAGAGPAPGEPF